MHPWYENLEDELRISQSSHFVFPAHLHDAMEMLYVETGRAGILLGDSTVTLHQGDAVFFFPNVIHGYVPPDAGWDGEPSRTVLLIAKPKLAGSYARPLQSRTPRCPILRASRLPEDFPRVIGQILRYHQLGEHQVSRAYLQVLLALVWEALDTSPNSDSAFQGLLYQALEYVTAHFREPLNLESAARALGLSRYQLSRLFTGRLGMGFVEYVNALRIQQAQQLLLNTDLPVTQVAYSCGFETPRTFNRVFLRQCGTTPSAYRTGG
ncbi:MAG: helix-turn-helix domain-containing protein [Oscillospiraceae bacterium]